MPDQLLPFDIDEAVRFAIQKVDENLVPFMDVYPADVSSENVYPIRRGYGGQPDGANIGWTPGFWPGMIWLAYELSGESRFREAGEHHVQSFLRRIEYRVDVEIHDLGFMYSPTCVAAWKLVNNSDGRKAALMAADTLMTRFWQAPGIFQAWGGMNDPNERGRTIIDSLMNMPLLYWASLETGDQTYHQAAHRHTLQVCNHFIRPDQTTFHTYYFDVSTGAGLYGRTAQGAFDDSCWARGQAWGIYGFALNYRYTGDMTLLETACRLADYFLAKLPDDKVAYWDLIFGEGSGEERDSSAAAIAACGLMEIASLLPPGSAQAGTYHTMALKIMTSLAGNYTSIKQVTSNAILLHGVAHKPGGVGVDEANLWGDYFYLEALARVKLPGWNLYW